jgi:hypothetical protein
LAPVLAEASFAVFGFYGWDGLQEELAGVGEGGSLLAGDVTRDLMDEEFAEDQIDGGSGLEIADSGEDVGSDEIASSDAAHLAIEMMVAKRIMARIVERGAAFAVGAEMLAATIGSG